MKVGRSYSLHSGKKNVEEWTTSGLQTLSVQCLWLVQLTQRSQECSVQCI